MSEYVGFTYNALNSVLFLTKFLCYFEPYHAFLRPTRHEVQDTGCSFECSQCSQPELFWSAFFPDFPAFSLSISPYSVRMRENPGKMRTRTTPNTSSFYAVGIICLELINSSVTGTKPICFNLKKTKQRSTS